MDVIQEKPYAKDININYLTVDAEVLYEFW